MDDRQSIKDLLAEFEADSNELSSITEEVVSYQVEAQTFSIPEGAALIEPGDQTAADTEFQPTVVKPDNAEWALLCVAGKENGQRITVRDTVTLGRSSKADFSVDDTLISRRHVTVSLRGDGLWVEDLDSSNGTFINDSQVTASAIMPGDKLTIGDATFIVEGPQTEVKTVVRSEPVREMPEATTPSPARRFCTNCGTKLKPNTKFCIECGKRY